MGTLVGIGGSRGGNATAGAVRYDTQQSLTEGQKEQARENIGAAGDIMFNGVSAVGSDGDAHIVVQPNSGSAPTESISNLKIGETVYSVEGSGSGGYNNIEAVVEALNAAETGTLKVGRNLFVAIVDVPDMWVKSNDEDSYVPYTYTTDAQFVEDLDAAGESGLQIGYFRVCRLEPIETPVVDVLVEGSSVLNGGVASITKAALGVLQQTAFTCVMSDGTTKTLTINGALS